MGRYVTIIFLFCVVTTVFGCTSKRGLVELNTRPPGATVYLNQIDQGITPVRFEYDFRMPAELEIKKDGYFPEVESLDEGWVVNEHLKGNYMEGRFTIQGERKKAWKVTTVRRLKKKERK